jgi:hypothetical protein
LLTAPLVVNLANPFGAPDSVGNDNFQSPNLFEFDVGSGPIPAGTIASHYVFFNPGPTLHVIGTVDFDADILGIITTTNDLAASDFLANTGVNYLNPGNRGLEVGDAVTISGPRQILFETVASSPGDYVRVLTAFSGHAGTGQPCAAGRWLDDADRVATPEIAAFQSLAADLRVAIL